MRTLELRPCTLSSFFLQQWHWPADLCGAESIMCTFRPQTAQGTKWALEASYYCFSNKVSSFKIQMFPKWRFYVLWTFRSIYTAVCGPPGLKNLCITYGRGQGDLLTCNISLDLLQMALSFQEHVAHRSLDIWIIFKRYPISTESKLLQGKIKQGCTISHPLSLKYSLLSFLVSCLWLECFSSYQSNKFMKYPLGEKAYFILSVWGAWHMAINELFCKQLYG